MRRLALVGVLAAMLGLTVPPTFASSELPGGPCHGCIACC